MPNYADQFALKAKTIFIAGACGLIGAEIARACASLGAKVILLDTQNEKGQALRHSIGGQAHFQQFDITHLESLEQNLNDLVKTHGMMHVWINATYPRTKDWSLTLEEMNIDYLRGNVDMHLNSCLWASRKVGLLMKEQKVQGSIINFGSIYGVQANDIRIYEGTALHGEMAYCAIKGGIINLTRYLAAHFGPSGIRANSICPGGVWDNQDPKFVEQYNARVPLRRMGTPEDIAGAAVFLASDASSYVSGTAFMVDGGWSAV